MKYPKISVIVPSFNQAKFIEDTLLSIIQQNYPNLELIVIDGGSTDESESIIKRYKDSITYWVSEPDGGQTQGLIKGFNQATGDVQCWLNSDDLHLSHTLHEVAEYFHNNPSVDAVFGNTLWVDENTLPIREQREIPFNRFIWMYTYNYIPGQSMFWRKTIYDKVGGLNPVGKIAHVSRIWSNMRFYPEQKNRSLRSASDKEDMIIRERYLGTRYLHFHKVKRTIAFTIRIIWKTITGCYSFGYKKNMN